MERCYVPFFATLPKENKYMYLSERTNATSCNVTCITLPVWLTTTKSTLPKPSTWALLFGVHILPVFEGTKPYISHFEEVIGWLTPVSPYQSWLPRYSWERHMGAKVLGSCADVKAAGSCPGSSGFGAGGSCPTYVSSIVAEKAEDSEHSKNLWMMPPHRWQVGQSDFPCPSRLYFLHMTMPATDILSSGSWQLVLLLFYLYLYFHPWRIAAWNTFAWQQKRHFLPQHYPEIEGPHTCPV